MVAALLAVALEKAVEAQEAVQEAVQEAEEEQAEVQAEEEVQAGEEWADTVWDLVVSAFVRIAGIVFLTAEAFRAHRRYAQSAERG